MIPGRLIGSCISVVVPRYDRPGALVYPFFVNEKDRWTWRDLGVEVLRTARVVVAAYLVVIAVVRPAAVQPLGDVLLHAVQQLVGASKP